MSNSPHHPVIKGDIHCGDVSIHYQDEGSQNNPAILLIMGLGSQLTFWPEELVSALIDCGFRVIRFDNRDIGLSGKSNKGVNIKLTKSAIKSGLGLRLKANYTLYDMVRDTACLINALNLAKVHVVGASMGGMIAQLFAAIYQHRTLSLTSIMSTTNERGYTRPRFDVMMNLAGYGVEKGSDRDTVIRRTLTFMNKISSPMYPTPESELLELIETSHDRAYRPGGQLRQSHAVIATGGFRRLLKRIDSPTQIIHGDSDPLIIMKGGIASYKAIPNAKLEIIRGMGHDFPMQLIPRLADLIIKNTRRSQYPSRKRA